MLLNKILLQIPVAAPDTVAANKIKEATNVVTSQVDSLASQLHPDSIAAMTPGKLVDKFVGAATKATLDEKFRALL